MWLNNLFFNVGESWSCFYVRKRKDPKKRVRLKYQRSNQKNGAGGNGIQGTGKGKAPDWRWDTLPPS